MLRAYLAHALALCPDPADPRRWQPALQEPYVVLMVDGQVLRLTWRATRCDAFLWEVGNCFPTPQAATQAWAALQEVVRHLHHLHTGRTRRRDTRPREKQRAGLRHGAVVT